MVSRKLGHQFWEGEPSSAASSTTVPCQIAGLPEARRKKAADAAGNDGCECWVAKWMKPRSRSVRVLVRQPEWLLVALSCRHSRVTSWCFTHLPNVPQRRRVAKACIEAVQMAGVDAGSLVVWCDANARLGSITSVHAQRHCPEAFHKVFEEFPLVAAHTCFAEGVPTGTSSRGTAHRLDHVGVPLG